MTIQELQEKDKSFVESLFISKINNIFVKLFTAIILDELKDVDHFINDDVYDYASNIIENANSKNARQMYDELNVKDSKILTIEENNECYIINVLLNARYMDYLIDKESGKYISGNNKYRTEDDYYLTFTKSKNATTQNIIKKCPGCGNSLSVNTSGVCPYCQSVYDQENHDWVLTSIKKR